MRILLIGNFLSSVTGTRGVSEDLAERLSDLGWMVLTTSQEVGRLAKLRDILFTIWHRRFEYEIAHVELYSGLAYVLAEITCLALKVARKPYLITLHGGNLPNISRRWPRRVRLLLQSAVAVTTPSRYLYDQMNAYSSKIRVLPNALNLSAYQFQKRYSSRPSLVWLRAFHKIYNPTLGVKVVALLVSEFPDIILTMIGPDKGDGSLEETIKLADKLGVNERIHFYGKVPKVDVPALLQKGDIFINTTNIDNTPVSVLEAMACGLCVVSTNVGGIPYLLDDGQNVLLLPPDSPEEMASAVRRILTEQDLSAYLSENSRVKASEFDWSAILPQWEALFSKVISKYGGRQS
jgi:glycosyltransferase involved in cell wall biosynthesis